MTTEPFLRPSPTPSRGSTGAQAGEPPVGGARDAGTPERAAGGRTAPPVFVELFAGVGGLTHDAVQHGARAYGIEFDPGTCDTRRAAGLPTVQGDVTKHRPSDFPQADSLAGGPPCQTFSVSGNGEGRRALNVVLALAELLAHGLDISSALAGLSDVRTGLVLEPLRWALQAATAGRPYRTIVLEQVTTVLPVWEAYARHLGAIGYRTATGIVRSEQYGVPQTRDRAVLIANLDHPVALPAPTHRGYRIGIPRDAGDSRLHPWNPMSHALPHRGEFTVISNYGTGGDPRNRGRRTSDEPAYTITGKVNRNRVVNPDGTEQDRFSPSEAGLLQGFPADYPWSDRDPYQQIGNAVAVPVGGALIRAATTPAVAVPEVDAIDWTFVGRRIHEARRGMGHTRQQLAEKVGLSVRTIGNLEHGRVPVSFPPALLLVGEALGLDLADLGCTA